jgi:branched-chain amino acid transport system substrate-binding protein
VTRSLNRGLAALAALVLVASACTGGDEAGEPVAPSTTAAGPSTTAAPFTLDTATCGNGYDAGRGVSDREIVIGQSVPLSGQYSGFGFITKGMKAYFDYANAELGGVGGRNLRLIARDDQYQSEKTAQNVADMLDKDGVFVFSGILGTPSNLAIRDELNKRCVPHLFPSSGAPDWGDVERFPWTVMGAVVPYNLEARMWVDYLRQELPGGGTIALLIANNEFGKTYEYWLKRYLEGTNLRIVATERHAADAANLNNEMTSLASSRADVAIGGTTATFCTQFMKAIGDNPSWKPIRLVSRTCKSGIYFGPAGSGAKGAIVVGENKDLFDPALAGDPVVARTKQLLGKYGVSDTDQRVSLVATGWLYAEILRDVLVRASAKQGGLTRPNVVLAARETSLRSGLLYDGVELKLDGRSDAYMVEAARFEQWDGAGFAKLTDVVSYEGQLRYEKPA